MRDYNRELHQLARQVAERYASHPHIEAILLTGSVAQDQGDEYSDIDLMLYYEQLPTAAECEQIKMAATAAGGGVYYHDPREGVGVYEFIDGVKVDLAHQLSTGLEARINQFLAEPSVDDHIQQIIMSGVRCGLPLYGVQKIRTWQAKLAQLPAGFGVALIKANLRFAPLAVVRDMGVKRHDFAFVYELLLDNVRHLFYVLCGLNGICPPGKIKSLECTLRQMALKPAHSTARFRALWLAPPLEMVSLWHELLLDVLALVDEHCPEVETAAVRQRLHLPLHRRVAPAVLNGV